MSITASIIVSSGVDVENVWDSVMLLALQRQLEELLSTLRGVRSTEAPSRTMDGELRQVLGALRQENAAAHASKKA
jgi:hypothetical protein